MHYFSGKGCSESLESMHYCIGILKKSVGNVKAWCEVYAYATGCVINIGEIKAERIVFAGSILALII